MRFPTEEELKRLESGKPYDGLPAGGGGDEWLDVFPSDLADYEAFVQFVLRSAAATVAGDSEARPFRSGLRDGIDVRATLRHWHEGELFVREPSREKVRITNAVIDFEGTAESCAFLRGERPPVTQAVPSQWMFWPALNGVIVPWTESDKLRVGSISRLCQVNETLQGRPLVQRLHRGLSLVTLDRPNDAPTDSPSGFIMRVISPCSSWQLTPLSKTTSRTGFGSSSPSPAASRSRTSAATFRGRKSMPSRGNMGCGWCMSRCDRIPAELRERNRTFRILNLTDEQWEVLRRRIAESKGARPVPREDEPRPAI